MRVNFLSAVWTTLAAIPPMLAQGGGAIVNVSSFAALIAPPRETIYAASKAALNAWSEGLWHDLHGSGVHVAIVNPGAIETEIWGKLDEPAAYQRPQAFAADRGRRDPRVRGEALLRADRAAAQLLAVQRAPDARRRARAHAARDGGVRPGARRRARAGARARGGGKRGA